MKIKTEKFNEYSKIMLYFVEKGHPQSESIYFDFENNFVYVSSNETKVCRINFDYEGERLENFYIPADKFFVLCNNYEEININLEKTQKEDSVIYKVIFQNESDRIEIPCEVEDLDFCDFNIEDLKEFELCIDNELLSILKKSSNYMSIDPENSLNGVFIINNHIVSTDKTKLFDTKLDDSHTNISNFTIDPKLLKILLMLKQSDVVKVYTSDNSIFVIIDDECEIRFSKKTNLALPIDPESEGFKKSYNLATTFIVEKDDLMSNLNFLEFFVRDGDVPQERIKIKIVDNETLSLNVLDRNIVEKKIKITECSNDLVGYDFWVSHGNLKQMLHDLGDGKIVVSLIPVVSEESPILDFRCLDDLSVNQHIILPKLYEEI